MSWIDPRKSYAYFISNYQLKPSTNSWYVFDCPFCDGEKVGAVHFGFGLVKCFKSCYSGDIIGFVAEVEDKTYEEAKALLWRLESAKIRLDDIIDTYDEIKTKDVKEIVLPEGYRSISQGTDALGIRARRYLTQRGFDIEQLDREGFGYCTKHDKDFLKDFFGYIIVPITRNGKLIYYLGRAFMDDIDMRYKNPPAEFVGVGKSEVIFNEAALHLYREVFTSEGWSDGRTLGKKGTARLGWSMSPTQKDMYMKSPAKRIVWFSDIGEEGGQTFYQKDVKQAMEFLDSGKEIYVVDLSQIPGLTKKQKDVNSIGRERCMEQYQKTQQLTYGLAMSILTTKKKKECL